MNFKFITPTMISKKRIVFIVLFLLLILIIIGSTIVILLDHNKKSESEVIEQTSVNIEIFTKIIESSRAWSDDFRILGCSGNTVIRKDELDVVYFEGVKDGVFDTWACNLYSPSKKEFVSLSAKESGVYLSEPMPLFAQYVESTNQRVYFNNLNEVISSEKVYEVAKKAGLNTNENFYNFTIGEAATNLFNDRYVWVVEERSKSLKDSDGGYVLIHNYYIDGKTGELLQIN